MFNVFINSMFKNYKKNNSTPKVTKHHNVYQHQPFRHQKRNVT